MSKKMQAEFDANFFDYKPLADFLLDYVCEMYSIREVIALLKSAGYTRAQLLYLRFDDIDISAVFDHD